MDLTKLSCSEFSKELATGAPTPGGGAVAALSGSFGAALISMVCSVTVGKEKYADYEELMQHVLRESEILRKKFLDEVDDDIRAYGAVCQAYKMSKETEEQQNERASKVQIALKEATLAPYSVITTSLTALEACSKVVNKSNVSAASDLAVAAQCIKTAVSGAYLNVLSNLGLINDIDFVSKYLLRAQEAAEKAMKLADSIYNTVSYSLLVKNNLL